MNKKEALSILYNSAIEYQSNLLHKNFLIVFQNADDIKDYEVLFLSQNFMHLTGIELKAEINGITESNANLFFRKCINRRLSLDEFDLKTDGSTQEKLEIITPSFELKKYFKMTGSFLGNKAKLYTEKLGGGVRACIGFVYSEYHGFFIPNTLLKEDIRKLTISIDKIIAIFSKQKLEKNYNKIEYTEKCKDIHELKLTREIKIKINGKLLGKKIEELQER